MAKRFGSTEIWNEDWFLEMPAEYKLYWYYMLAKCDHAGLFKVNVKVFCTTNGVTLTSKIALEYFNADKERIRVISESVWYIEDFFVFQYGDALNLNNRVHESISELYKRQNIELTSIRGLKVLKDRVKDKDKDKDIDKDRKKGGVGENKRAVEVDTETLEAIFEDGRRQSLGFCQKGMLEIGELKAKDVYWGLSN